MKKCTTITVLVALLTTTASAFAQKIDSTTIGGYVMVTAPNKDTSGFVNRWSVAKAKVYVDRLCFDGQYDFASNTLIAAQGCYTSNIKQGSLTLYAGRTFTAAGQITPAPQCLMTEWWHQVFMTYSFIEDGLGLAYSRGSLNTYVVRGKELSAAATFKGFQVLWQENHATTCALEGRLIPFINQFVGATFFKNGGENQYTVMSTAYITKTLSLNWGGDAGRVEEGRFGGCWDITPHVRLKAAYTVRAQKTFAEIVCYF